MWACVKAVSSHAKMRKSRVLIRSKSFTKRKAEYSKVLTFTKGKRSKQCRQQPAVGGIAMLQGSELSLQMLFGLIAQLRIQRIDRARNELIGQGG